nr:MULTISPECIES: hypothetical protein [unclassified Moorella (in: firmicutes)]
MGAACLFLQPQHPHHVPDGQVEIEEGRRDAPFRGGRGQMAGYEGLAGVRSGGGDDDSLQY